MLNVLDDNETDINKIQMYLTIFYSQAQWKTHVKLYKREKQMAKFLMKMRKIFFNELVNLIYEEKLKLLKEELLKQWFFLANQLFKEKKNGSKCYLQHC